MQLVHVVAAAFTVCVCIIVIIKVLYFTCGSAIQLCHGEILEPRLSRGQAAVATQAHTYRHGVLILPGFTHKLCPLPVRVSRYGL